jgi:hypothetical protein
VAAGHEVAGSGRRGEVSSGGRLVGRCRGDDENGGGSFLAMGSAASDALAIAGGQRKWPAGSSSAGAEADESRARSW